MITALVITVFIGFFLLFLGFIAFCQWILSRREVNV